MTDLKTALLAVLVAAFCASPVLALDQADDFMRARAVFLDALDTQGDALDKATGRFTALAEKSPGNPLYQSYLGACLALQGKAAWWPWNKMKYTEQGLGKIDGALAALDAAQPPPIDAEGKLEVKFVAAQTFIKTPDRIFHRAAEGKRLLAEITASPDLPAAAPAFREMVRKFAAWVKENN